MHSDNIHKTLLKVLFERSFRYEKGAFVLSSGLKSDVYIDVKKTVYSPEGMELTGRVLYEHIKDERIDGLGGLTLGADPLAYAAAFVSVLEGRPLEVFVVRKEPKKHGTARWIEGNLAPGARVVVIDDVATTGASTVKAVERAREAGFEVVKALVLVDREEGGREAIGALCRVEAVFTKTELMALRRDPGRPERRAR